MVIEEPELGIFIKLPGRVSPDPTTGQLTTTFGEPGHELPQLPFSHFRLHFKEGPRAPLTTPATCGEYTTEAKLYPYARPEEPLTRTASFKVDGGAGGGACAQNSSRLPSNPSFSAGTLDPRAGSYSPFVLHLSREDGSQQLELDQDDPPRRPAREARRDPLLLRRPDRPGAGAHRRRPGRPRARPAELPAVLRSRDRHGLLGRRPEPLYVGGHVYLAGPYKGAPLSLEIVTPAIAGPFDLGAVAVRTALRVDPLTTQITAESDPIPTILHGLPLDVRSISLQMSRPDFTLNPTSCEPKQVTGSATTTLGAVAPLSQYFQASGCRSLAFRPKLALTLKGSTTRTGHPALKAVLTYPKAGAYANIARAQVNLPHSEFIEQANLDKTCTKPVLLEGRCPKRAIYGKAKAWSPLLEKPLEGPVYLVGGFGFKLPALVAELDGQIRVLLAGKVDSGPNGGIRNTFEAIPDAPVERFVLELKGGPKYSLLINSEDLCRKPQKAIARFTAQNGAVSQTKPVIANGCGKGKKGGGKKRSKGGGGGKKHKG